jgi:hypothetical protein
MSINFTRWSGIAALLAGLIIIAGRFLTEPFTGQYLLSGLLAIVGLIGLLLVLRREGAGRWGLFGILATLTGNLFFAIERLIVLAELLYMAGIILLAIGMWKTGVLPRWLPALWILVPLVGLSGVILALTGSDISLTTPAIIVLGLALIGSGYGLWTAPAPLTTPAPTSN